MQGTIQPKNHLEMGSNSSRTIDSAGNGGKQRSSESQSVGGPKPTSLSRPLQTSITSNTSEQGDCMKDSSDDENSHEWCPLFMDGLPTNFASNNALAAIASLLNDSGDDEKKKEQAKVTPRKGGGKVSRRMARRSKNKTSQNSPYDLPAGRKENEELSKKSATMGEAQLFLSMWKI